MKTFFHKLGNLADFVDIIYIYELKNFQYCLCEILISWQFNFVNLYFLKNSQKTSKINSFYSVLV